MPCRLVPEGRGGLHLWNEDMRALLLLILSGGLLIYGSAPSAATELEGMCRRIEKLDLGRGGYTLGRILSDQQRRVARENALSGASPGTYKFKDRDLVIVAETQSHRIIVLYEEYAAATREKLKAVVGDLYLEFGNPTVMAHDKIIYWAYDHTGKINENRFQQAKEKNEKLDILATIKLNSSEKILGDDGPQTASMYYVIASEPALRLVRQP